MPPITGLAGHLKNAQIFFPVQSKSANIRFLSLCTAKFRNSEIQRKDATLVTAGMRCTVKIVLGEEWNGPVLGIKLVNKAILPFQLPKGLINV